MVTEYDLVFFRAIAKSSQLVRPQSYPKQYLIKFVGNQLRMFPLLLCCMGGYFDKLIAICDILPSKCLLKTLNRLVLLTICEKFLPKVGQFLKKILSQK